VADGDVHHLAGTLHIELLSNLGLYVGCRFLADIQLAGDSAERIAGNQTAEHFKLALRE